MWWRRTTGADGRGALWAVLAWAATRAVLLLALFGVWRYPGDDVRPDVAVIYHGWYEHLLTGSFPVGDVTWQYPPVAAAAFLAPALLPFLSYASAFYLLACAADALVFALLLRAARAPGGRLDGAWLWIVGVAVLGPIALARYDVMATAVAVAALLAVARYPRVAGVLAGIGAMVKVWPVLVLAGVARGRATRRVWGAAAATVAALGLVFLVFTRGAFAFLTEQRQRGIEIESLGALPFHVARYLGLWSGTSRLHYGSFEFLGPYVHTMSKLVLASTVLAFGWLVWWRLKARAFDQAVLYDAAFTAVLVFITTSRVISPQYLIWLLGLGGVCLAHRRTAQRLPIGLVLVACVFTVLEFPIGFGPVVRSNLPGIAVLLVRNGLLLVASVWACRQLWRGTSPPRTQAAQPRRVERVTA
ncbi:glycosyltransferase 87 family protein [Streptomyces sp. RPT161]|uniref:glycosyltransferase 87 family protein n=1 Tax=Streptomyces sp. RPT161 TaxID=3015993 RepID=UPI0022B8C0EF|nr:glycosyltransferase 87 family protein [Streptomyces sp. RPT161]